MYYSGLGDIIKNSVLKNFTGTISAGDMLISLVVAFLLGLFIIMIYKKTFSGVVFSKSFALCTLMLAMVTAMIIRTINANISLSLGMVGALSIVRFRTAVKEPVDTGFMFWAIAAGIMCGAGLYLPAIAATLVLGLLYYCGYLFNLKAPNRYLLVIRYHNYAQAEISRHLQSLRKYKLRSKSVFAEETELTISLDLKENKNGQVSTECVDVFKKIDGVINASLITYQNDFGA